MEEEAEKQEGYSKSDDKPDEKNKQQNPEEEKVKKQEEEPHKDAKQQPQGATAVKQKFQRAKVETPAGSACMSFCGNEPPPAKRKRRGQSRERKEALNRGASKERQSKQREASAAAAAAAAAKKKKENASKGHSGDHKHQQPAHQVMEKRQDKPISFIDCPICHKVFRNAVEIECGHVFCNACLRRKMGRHKRCPTCKSEIEYIHPCYVVRELVEKFGVKDGPKKLKAELLQVSGYYDEYAFEDPIIVASQFIPEPGAGAFDPADLYKIARLDEYVSVEEYLDTIKMVNHIIASWDLGSSGACFGSICCCFMPSPAQKAVNMIEVVLGDCNLRWPETGLFWTLMFTDGDARSARFLGDRFYLTMRIDRAKARTYQSTLRASALKKDAEMARLRKQNALMRHKMLELGENGFIRALAGRKSPRYSLKTGPSLMFVEEYPDYPVISPHTLRDLVLHNPASKRFFIAPWNRIRSTSSGPLPINSAEDFRMRSQLNSVVSSRSPSPYVDRNQRSPSPATSRPKSPGDRSRPWR